MNALNRRTRRAQIRSIRSGLRGAGCTCTPDVVLSPASERPAWATIGGAVRHELGCTFGDKFLAANAAGLYPTVIAPDSPGCRR